MLANASFRKAICLSSKESLLETRYVFNISVDLLKF